MVVVLSSTSSKTLSCSNSNNNNNAESIACKSARLLLLGDKQVGKSASIVRYTTGRFIQEYSSAASNDWLYYRLVATENQTSNVKQQQQQQQNHHHHHLPSQLIVELLEQKDIQFSNSGNFFAPTATTIAAATTTTMTTTTTNTTSNSNDNNHRDLNKQQQSLSSRVALDQLIDQELHEKQQMLERLRWADAYIVMYSISDIQSFQKAIKYLNLIANNINFPIGADSAHSKTSPPPTLLPVTNLISSNNNTNTPIRRPILLLANKRDLENDGRQVQTSDGRHLAIRHQSMFAEISVSQTGRHLEQLLYDLLQLIEPASLHSSTSSGNNSQKCPTNFEHLITSCTQQQQQQQQQQSRQQNDKSYSVSFHPLIGLWRARRRSSEQHCHQIVNSKARQASLVKSQPVSANSVVQNCRLLVGSIGGGGGGGGQSNGNSESQQATITSALCTAAPPKVKSNSLESIGHQPQKQSMSIGNGNKAQASGRYENFKSSFKKASMAIVGSRALSKKSPLELPADLKSGTSVDALLPAPTSSSASSSSIAMEAGSLEKSTLSSSPSGDSPSSATKESLKQQRRRNLTNQPSSSSSTGSVSLSTGSMSSSTGWLRNHMRLNRGGVKTTMTTTTTTTVPQMVTTFKKSTSSSDPKLTDSINGQHTILDPTSTSATTIAHSIPNETLSDRIKRPLLKYKNRRKTVAFEQMNQEVAAAAAMAAETSSISDESRRHTYHNDLGCARRPSILRHSSLLLGTTIEEQLAVGGNGDSTEGDGLPANYNSARQSSGRSSCSLASYPGDIHHHTYHSSLLVLSQGVESTAAAATATTSRNSDRAPSSVGSASVCSSSCSPNDSSNGSSNHQLNKSMSTASNNLYCSANANSKYNDSRSGTLSRSSTSAGEEMCTDDAAARLPPAGTGNGDGRQVVAVCYPIQRIGSEIVTSSCIRPAAAKSAKLASVPSSASLAGNDSSSLVTPKKRYQLVKSVQKTLTNLTRSSYVNNGQPAAKKSICTGLIKGSTDANVTPLLLKSTQMVEPNLAKTEQVRHVMPMIVGYCK